MSMITDVWNDLVRRRLWPVAVLLLLALIAVPFLLSKDPAPAPAAPAVLNVPGVKKGDVAVTGQPVVALADEGEARRRRVLGARKDPFRPAPLPKATTADTTTPQSGTGGSTPTTGGASSGPSAPAGETPAPGAPTPAPTKPKVYPAESLTVRFAAAEAGDGVPRKTLEKLQPLLFGEDPLVVYLGLRKGGKEAVFLVDASLVPQGDGTCESSGSSDCETVALRAGETEFFDVKDPETGAITAQYQLDVLKIHGGKPATTSRAPRRVARAAIVDALGDGAWEAVAQDARPDVTGVTRLLAGL